MVPNEIFLFQGFLFFGTNEITSYGNVKQTLRLRTFERNCRKDFNFIFVGYILKSIH